MDAGRGAQSGSGRRLSVSYVADNAYHTPMQGKQGLDTPPPHMPAAGAYLASLYTGTPCSTPGSELRQMDNKSAVARFGLYL